MFKDKNKLFFYIGLSIVFFLVLIVLFLSIYEAVTGEELGENSIINSPQIIAVVVGLILSLLFFERWKSLESQVRKLSEGPVVALKNIQDYTKEEIQQRFEYIENKAQTLSANVSSLLEKHPWLEVITDRQIIVETDSCRGILRTSYSLLQDDKILHLFEYLEYCSRKGTGLDKREKTTYLRGTADDFYELSYFCEIWLGDYYLSSEFLKRYIEQYPDSAYILLPEYIRKLLRIGDLESAHKHSNSLRKKVYGNRIIEKIKIYFKVTKSVSERYKWSAANILALTDATFCDYKRMNKYLKRASDNPFSTVFSTTQKLFDAELSIQIGAFETAKTAIEEIERGELGLIELNELSHLYAKLGDYNKATYYKDILNQLSKETFGDNDKSILRSNKRRKEKSKNYGKEDQKKVEKSVQLNEEIIEKKQEKSHVDEIEKNSPEDKSRIIDK